MAEFYGVGEVFVSEFDRERVDISLSRFWFWQKFTSLLSLCFDRVFSLCLLDSDVINCVALTLTNYLVH